MGLSHQVDMSSGLLFLCFSCSHPFLVPFLSTLHEILSVPTFCMSVCVCFSSSLFSGSGTVTFSHYAYLSILCLKKDWLLLLFTMGCRAVYHINLCLLFMCWCVRMSVYVFVHMHVCTCLRASMYVCMHGCKCLFLFM